MPVLATGARSPIGTPTRAAETASPTLALSPHLLPVPMSPASSGLVSPMQLAAMSPMNHAGILSPMAEMPRLPPSFPLFEALAAPAENALTDIQVELLRRQVEFYFSVENLCKDIYLRSHMDEKGWTPLELIASFPKVQRLGASAAGIAE